MAEENKTPNDLYREMIDLHSKWREENKTLLLDNQTAIRTLGELEKRFQVFNRLIIASIVFTLVVCCSVLIYKGKLKICKVEFAEFSLSMTTNNCQQPND